MSGAKPGVDGGISEDFANLAMASVERSGDTIFWLNRDARIVYANAAAERSLGYSREELVGKTIHEVDCDFPPEAWMPHVEELRVKQSLRFESRHRAKDGRIVPVEVTCNYFERDGGYFSFAFNRDISERRQAEAELTRYRERLEELVEQRTAELQRAMAGLLQAEKLAALVQLVAGVAHELNTPLGNARTVASSFAETVREVLSAVDGGGFRRSQLDSFVSRAREAASLLESNTSRAAELIEQFKQVAVDQTSVRRRRFDLAEAVAELLAAMQPQFRHSKVRLEVSIPDGVEMDSFPGPLGQVIANLVGNALVHAFDTGESGLIRIEAKKLEDDAVLLSCVDTGKGMTAEVRKRVFEPFFTTSLGKGGSGLGLYIAHNLVTTVLGGSIAVHPVSSGGTRFDITLPIRAPKEIGSVQGSRPRADRLSSPDGS